MKRIAAIVILALGGFVVAYSLHLRMYTSSGPGAGLFPILIGAMLCILSVIWLAQETWEATPAPVPAADAAPATGSRATLLLQVVAQLACLILFGLLLQPVGYVVAAVVLSVGTALVAGERNWFWIAVIALFNGPGVKILFNALGTTI